MAIQYKANILQLLKSAGYNTTRLRRDKLLGEATIQKLREGQLVSWANVDTICGLLNCDIGDILERTAEEKDGAK